MNLGKYLADPWREVHPEYDRCAFHMRPAPEFATSEVLIASLYRAVGFSGIAEGAVPELGRELDKRTQRKRAPQPSVSHLSDGAWRSVLHGVLESPKQPNQSSRRFVQLMPLVPDAALYSGSARLSRNSWNPGQLIQRMIAIGSAGTNADALWRSLFDSLSITDADDVWARWLQLEFHEWKPSGVDWAYARPAWAGLEANFDWKCVDYPAKQAVQDIGAVLSSKRAMTRRQWVTILEAVVRLSAVSHVLWLCTVNERLWRAIRHVLAGSMPLTGVEVATGIIARSKPYLRYGVPGVPMMRDMTSHYLSARLGINLVLWYLADKGVKLPPLSQAAGIVRLLDIVAEERSAMTSAGILDQFLSLQDDQARVIACKKGIGSNISEFTRHVLGRRQTASDALRGYDQGYALQKRGAYNAAPWIVSLGPVSVLSLVHCCLSSASGPRSVHRLQAHLMHYGIDVHLDDISRGDLGHQLRMLGLVIDSPDAESGMLLLPPFQNISEDSV